MRVLIVALVCTLSADGTLLVSTASGAVTIAGANLAATEIKKIADGIQGDPATRETVRAALQAVVGCAGATAGGSGSCGSAATGAAASVVLNNLINAIDSKIGPDGRELPLSLEDQQARTNLVGTLIAAIATGVGLDAAAATTAGTIETENNNNVTLPSGAVVKVCGGADTANCKNVSYFLNLPSNHPDRQQINLIIRDYGTSDPDELNFIIGELQRGSQTPQTKTQIEQKLEAEKDLAADYVAGGDPLKRASLVGEGLSALRAQERTKAIEEAVAAGVGTKAEIEAQLNNDSTSVTALRDKVEIGRTNSVSAIANGNQTTSQNLDRLSPALRSELADAFARLPEGEKVAYREGAARFAELSQSGAPLSEEEIRLSLTLFGGLPPATIANSSGAQLASAYGPLLQQIAGKTGRSPAAMLGILAGGTAAAVIINNPQTSPFSEPDSELVPPTTGSPGNSDNNSDPNDPDNDPTLPLPPLAPSPQNDEQIGLKDGKPIYRDRLTGQEYSLDEMGQKVSVGVVGADVDAPPIGPSTIIERQKHHDTQAQVAANELRSQGYTIPEDLKQVTFGGACTIDGRCRTDFAGLDPNGKLVLFEVKTGDASLSIRQSAIYPQIKDGNAIPFGDVAEKLKLMHGIPLKDQGYPNGIPIIEIRKPGLGR